MENSKPEKHLFRLSNEQKEVCDTLWNSRPTSPSMILFKFIFTLPEIGTKGKNPLHLQGGLEPGPLHQNTTEGTINTQHQAANTVTNQPTKRSRKQTLIPPNQTQQSRCNQKKKNREPNRSPAAPQKPVHTHLTRWVAICEGNKTQWKSSWIRNSLGRF